MREWGDAFATLSPLASQCRLTLPEEWLMFPRYQLLTALVLITATMDTTAVEQTQDSDNPWQWTLEGGAVHQIETSLDAGGDMSVTGVFAGAGAARVFAGRWRVGAALGYGMWDYGFSGSSGFGGLDPWNRIHDFRVSAPIQYFANERWTVFAMPSLRFDAESGASLSDGMNGGLLAGATYRFSEALSIGPGVGVFTQIEDDAQLLPILLIDWQITDILSLETGGGSAASRGPGLQLRWQYSPRWQLALGSRYEKFRFRLDDSGPAPEGVGQEKAFPLYALAEFAIWRDAKLTLVGGAEVGASLRLEDASGNLIRDSDLSTAPFFGATFEVKL
jgi:hypothetical protein